MTIRRRHMHSDLDDQKRIKQQDVQQAYEKTPQAKEAVQADELQAPTSQAIRQNAVANHASQHGNRATSSLVQRKQSVGDQEKTRRDMVMRAAQEEREEADPIVETTMNFGEGVHQPQWGTERRVQRPDPFSAQNSGGNVQRQPAAIQRADASAGGVSFDVTSFSATVAGGASISESAAGMDISSNQYTATGTVKATGPKSKVKNWDLGFLQTVYRSDRNFYWTSARTKLSDHCDPIPVRDGDTGVQPWYGNETVSAFTEAASDTQTSRMDDTPGTSTQPWKDPNGTGGAKEPESLDHTDGKDIFRSWLAVRNRTDYHKLYLRWADWEMNYSTSVDTSKAVGSRVTAGKAAGAKVLATGNGRGGKQPELFDPVANTAAKDTLTTW